MNPEIEELRKFAKATVTKARLDKLVVATAAARSLFEVLELKPGNDEDAEEFESAQSELESALDELESASADLTPPRRRTNERTPKTNYQRRSTTC